MDEASARYVLGLAAAGYNAAEVRRAYRRMALQCHPDKHLHRSGKTAEEAKERFRDITSAKNLLLEKLRLVPTPPKQPKPGLDQPELSTRQKRRARWCKNVERVISVEPSEPPHIVVWACHVCEMAAMGGYSPGARKDRVIPCVQPGPQTLCFCGHLLSEHSAVDTPSKDGWERCQKASCLCARFNYVRPHSTCTCGHSSVEHSAKPFFACKVTGCTCQTYHDPGTCHVCSHDWVSHRTELRFSVPSKREASPSSSSCSCSSEQTFIRRRPMSANPSNVVKQPALGKSEVKRPLSARAPGAAPGTHVARVMEALSARGPRSSLCAQLQTSAPSSVRPQTPRTTRPETPRAIRPETPRSIRPGTAGSSGPRTTQPRSYAPRKPDEVNSVSQSRPSSSPDGSPLVAQSPDAGAKVNPSHPVRTSPSLDLPWLHRTGPVRARMLEPRMSITRSSTERGGRWAHPTVASGL